MTERVTVANPSRYGERAWVTYRRTPSVPFLVISPTFRRLHPVQHVFITIDIIIYNILNEDFRYFDLYYFVPDLYF